MLKYTLEYFMTGDFKEKMSEVSEKTMIWKLSIDGFPFISHNECEIVLPKYATAEQEKIVSDILVYRDMNHLRIKFSIEE